MRTLVIAMLGSILLWSISCKTAKEAGPSAVRIPKKLDKTLSLVNANSPQYESLTISGKATAEIPGEGFDVRVNYRMNILKDSLIWIRVSKLGIEAARVMITRDSVFVLDNLQEQYVRSGYDPAKKFTGLAVDFSMLEDLIVGNLHIIPRRFKEIRNGANAGWVELNGEENGTEFTYSIDKNWLKLAKIYAYNPWESQQTEILYSAFQKHGKGLMPQEGKIRVTLPKELKLDFSHSRVRVNPEKMSLKFNIPSNYTYVSG